MLRTAGTYEKFKYTRFSFDLHEVFIFSEPKPILHNIHSCTVNDVHSSPCSDHFSFFTAVLLSRTIFVVMSASNESNSHTTFVCNMNKRCVFIFESTNGFPYTNVHILYVLVALHWCIKCGQLQSDVSI